MCYKTGMEYRAKKICQRNFKLRIWKKLLRNLDIEMKNSIINFWREQEKNIYRICQSVIETLKYLATNCVENRKQHKNEQVFGEKKKRGNQLNKENFIRTGKDQRKSKKQI